MAIHILAVLEDTVINATRGDKGWVLDVSDNITGAAKTVVTSDAEFGAAMALAIGGDDSYSEVTTDELYRQTEQLMKYLEVTVTDPSTESGTKVSKVLRFIP